MGGLCQGLVVLLSFSKAVHWLGSGRGCLFSASLGHLLLRMSALWHQDKLTGGEHKPSEVKLAEAADSRLMEGVPELVVGLVESATCCGR